MTISQQDETTISPDMHEWNSLAGVSMEIEGYSQIGGKDNEQTLELLKGVPFIIKNAIFRKGDVVPDGDKEPRDYVSLECLVHPSYVGRFKRKYIIFNDGSTGVYRQVVAALAARGSIVLDEKLPEEGGAHATRFDVSPTLAYGAERPDHVEYADLNLKCPEGVRKSEYDQEGRPGKGITWYLA